MRRPNIENMRRQYIANQSMTEEQLDDEVRWLFANMLSKSNISLQGEPGNGKSSAIRFIADLLGKTVFARNCDRYELTQAYTGLPSIKDGNSSYSNTALKRALKNGGIFLNEESSEMPPSVQKFLSSLLSDDRHDAIIPTEDGSDRTLEEWMNKEDWKVDDFIYMETFNPSHNASGKDNFEESHCSRMDTFEFSDIDSLLSAYIAFDRIGIDIDLPLEERGILNKGDGTYKFTEKKDDTWFNLLGEKLSPDEISEENHSTYLFFNRENLNPNLRDTILENIEKQGAFYLKAMKYLTLVRALASSNVSRKSDI
jgi:hypothetical protein